MSETSPESTGATRPSEELKATAAQATAAVASEVREGIAQVREQAAARTEETKRGFAEEISATAKALDEASRAMSGHPLQRGLLREASTGLAGLAEALRGRSAGALAADAAEFGRRNPVAFLGGAALAGFALARLASASAPDAEESYGEWPEPHPAEAPVVTSAPSFEEGALP